MALVDLEKKLSVEKGVKAPVELPSESKLAVSTVEWKETSLRAMDFTEDQF